MSLQSMSHFTNSKYSRFSHWLSFEKEISFGLIRKNFKYWEVLHTSWVEYIILHLKWKGIGGKRSLSQMLQKFLAWHQLTVVMFLSSSSIIYLLSWDFDACSSPKRCLTMLWCKKLIRLHLSYWLIKTPRRVALL